jgi:hypothetical protein
VHAVPCDRDSLEPLAGIGVSEAFAGDSTRAELAWPEGTLDVLRGREVHFKFICKNANVFSYWFEA